MVEYKALIVEDSPTMRQLLVYAVGRLKGVEIHEADDGLTALKKVQEQRFDLIITDINMPLMDGFKLLSTIRHEDLNVPIIVITTESSGDDRERAMALGATLYLTKPIQSLDVTRACRKLLSIE